LRFDNGISSTQLRGILEDGGWKNPTIREFPAKNEMLVRVQEFGGDSKELSDRIVEVISQALPDNHVVSLQNEGVGPAVGAELRQKSAWAILFALIALLIYIAITFWSFAYAVGAVVALAHDALVMVGIFLLFDRDISINVIGAILAVLGYSINDTIVIFSRIREVMKKSRGASLYQVVNTSINQTLRRTILTSVSTALAVVSMLVLGGEALRDFSLTLLVGVIFGTYSSIFIASPVMMMLYKKEDKAA
jgi:preprotein translocase SecF subunit